MSPKLEINHVVKMSRWVKQHVAHVQNGAESETTRIRKLVIATRMCVPNCIMKVKLDEINEARDRK